MLYRGYVRTKNKVAIDKFKDVSDLRSLEEIKNFEEYAGVLNDDIILIDIDDYEMSETLMDIVEHFQINCRVIETTRGKHFLFKNSDVRKNFTGVNLAIGIKADIKIGSRNSYQVLKVDNKDRFVLWEEVDELAVLPKFLSPVKHMPEFESLSEGDGRNSALFKYILTLTSEGFSKDETRQTLNIINDFVLKESLDEKEISTILRDEAFPKRAFFEGRTFIHNAFADFLIAEKHIKRINGQLHVYKDGTYIDGQREIESAMIEYVPSLKSANRTEVLKYLEISVEEIEESDARHIAFNNGIYDILQDKLIDFSPEIVTTNKIPWDYVPQAYYELTDRTLDRLACNDKNIRLLLEEAIGYCFYRRNQLSKAFILTGDRSNGKSTYLDLVKGVLGDSNYVSLDLSELEERFSVASMAGKLANVGDDISDDFMRGRSVATFKKIVSGNKVKGEFKGQDAFFFEPYAKLLFSANEMPRIKDKTGAVMRRLVIIPFNAKFSPSDPDFDPYIVYKLLTQDSLEYLIKLGIEGLKRVLANNKFTTSKAVEQELEVYQIENSPVLQYLQTVDEGDIFNQNSKSVYRNYKMFCLENGYQEMTLGNLTKELKRHLPLDTKRVSIDGKQRTMYVRVDES